MASEETCAICLTPKTNPAKPHNCKHSFCLNCLDRWAQHKDYCPLCRQPFKYLECNFNSSSKEYEVLRIGLFKRRGLSRSEQISQPPTNREINEIVTLIDRLWGHPLENQEVHTSSWSYRAGMVFILSCSKCNLGGEKHIINDIAFRLTRNYEHNRSTYLEHNGMLDFAAISCWPCFNQRTHSSTDHSHHSMDYHYAMWMQNEIWTR